MPLSESERRELLRVARATLKEHLRSGRLPPGAPHVDALLEPRGAFVSLHARGGEGGRGALRGCIGIVHPTTPLYRAVQEAAVGAATRDPRFDPVRREDLDSIEIEISALGELRRIASPDEVDVGVHGLYVTREEARGVLLPHVAVEHGWDRETFLAETCAKAGLDADAWRDPRTRVQVFTAEVFREGPPRGASGA